MDRTPESGTAKRELEALTAPVEKKVLVWLARRAPAWVSADHLTALGLLGMAGAGVAYALAARSPYWLHAVNACLVVDWLGENLDGTAARVRNRQRPHCGFYVDPMVDALGSRFILLGLAASGLIAPWIAVAIVISHYFLDLNIYLAVSALGVYKISHGVLGGTELRLLLMVVNLVVLAWPRVRILGASPPLFDILGAAGAAGLAFIALRSVAQVTKMLYERERV